MGSSRVLLAGLTVAVLVGAGACARPGVNVEPATAATESPSPSPSPVDPLAELVAAIGKTHGTTLTFTIDSGLAGVGKMHGAGAVDPANHRQSFDFTKMSPELATPTIPSNVGDAFKALPFTATADDQGRLTSMVIKMPSMGAGMPATTVTTRFSDFGAPVKIQAPPNSQVQEAPKDFFP